MRLLTPLAVFVVAVLTTQVQSKAEETTTPQQQLSPVSFPSEAQCYSSNGFDQYRHRPDLGGPHSAGYGFKHFSLPFQNYTLWHRPKAATLTKAQRCTPDAFRPRGLGHLFAEPCDSYRMEYSPYVLNGSCSKYGPTYQLRREDQRCDDCDH